MMTPKNRNEKCARCAATVTWLGVLDGVVLAVLKGVVGALTGSRALLASGLYSIHDVVAGIAVLVGLKMSTQPADSDHPYGHGNVEYVVSVFTSVLILVGAIFLVADSARLFLTGQHDAPSTVALATAIVSVFANAAIYRFNMCGHKHMNSPVLRSHAEHHHADAISSLAVVGAIVGGMLGYRYLDALVALFEGGHLIVVSAGMLYHGGAGLVDRAIGEKDLSLIREGLRAIPDVTGVRNIRTRQIGRSVWIDLYVSLPPDRTIAEVESISHQIRGAIEKTLRHVGNVNVICV